MSADHSRRDFLGVTAAACGAATFFGLSAGHAGADPLTNATKTSDPSGAPVAPGFPRQELDAVREVVGASHARFDRVKELVTARPALAKAAWDWGFGDWETAIGAASHTGQRKIAELLIQHGARPNLFTFAMLGQVDVVRTIISANPGFERIHGPHDITLLQHARNRLSHDHLSNEERENAAKTVAYLESLPGADVTAPAEPVSDAQKQAYMGRYLFGTGADDVLIVGVHRTGHLTIGRGKEFPHIISHVEPYAFAPRGAPDVRLRFGMKNDRAESITVHDPIPLLKAVRTSDAGKDG
jgi:hypothetical protein